MRSTDFHFKNNYSPFRVTSGKPDAVRPLANVAGVEDRLRIVAFAEILARDLFRYGAERFAGEVPAAWVQEWLRFAEVEDKHAQMLLTRFQELGHDLGARSVSDKLSRLCRAATDPILFIFLLASAEERGMEAGSILGTQMHELDPVSANIFAAIAKEEIEHVESSRLMLAPHAGQNLKDRARDLSATL